MAANKAARQIDSRDLLAGAPEVRIVHNGQEYRLRQTRNGKLILTK
ncbi:MAG: hemin uptake protein HemP [Rudaea sp.]|nr:hemin uptake protein HemP [Rudaea sp.]